MDKETVEYQVGDKVRRSKFIRAGFGAEFNGGKEIEEIVKIEPNDYNPKYETKLWLSNGYWVAPSMVEKVENNELEKE